MAARKTARKPAARGRKATARAGKNNTGRRRVIERATDLAIALYAPALKELEKH
jgi:hypothetical protein